MADDWWDDMYDDAGEQKPMRTRRPKRTRRGSSTPAPERIRVEVTRPAAPERESIREAAASLLPTDPGQARRWQIVGYWGSAATAGHLIGLHSWMADGMTSTDSTAEGVWVGVGLAVLAGVLELRTHGLRDPARHWLIRTVGWIARVPLATALLALALYGPDAAL